MKTLKTTILLVCLVSLVGCLANNDKPGPIVDPNPGTSTYYVINKSTSDLNVAYEFSSSVSWATDSTVTVSVDSTAKIIRLTGNFSPSAVFTQFSFYKLSDQQMEAPVLVVKPIVNDHWDNVTKKDGYLRNYKLVITDKDLK